MANCVEEQYGCDSLADLKARLGEAIAHENSHGDTFLTLQTIVAELSDLLCKVEHGEREWRDTFDAVQNPIFVHDQNHRIIRANQAYARKAGQNIRDVIGKPYWQVFPKGRGPLAQCTCQPRQNGIPQSIEVTLDSGETYLSRAFTARDAQDRYLYSVHILEDITEQRRLQAALTESAERYRSLFEGAPDAIFLADADTGQLLDANPAAERLIGRSREEILTLHQSQLHPADAPAVEDFKSHVRAALTNTPHPPSEIPVLCADGREIPTEISAKVFHLDGRRVIQGVFRDITARKRAEEKLTETGNKLSLSLHLLEGIVESVPIRVFWKDRDLRYLGCNNLFAKDAGLSGPDELIGKTDFDLSWKDQAALYREDDLRVMKSGMPRLGYEEPQTTPDGKTIWLRTSKVPLRDDSQEVIGILGIYDDITRQKQAEQDLLLSESRLKEAQGVAHLGSWELDLVKNELWWSDENYRIFGTEPGTRNTYETFLDTVHPDDRAFVNKAYSDSVENRTPYDIEHRLLMKDGSVKWVNERCKTYYDPQGKPLRSAGTTLDITKQHLTAQALSRSNRALRAISACNSVLIHATNEAELLNNMCRVIIDEGGYRFAWIGFADGGEEKLVRPVAHAGFEDGYLEHINVTYADDEHGHGPAGCAVRHGELQVVHDTLDDPHFTPWREAAAKRGYRSVLSLPLKNETHQVFAVLSIYAGEPDAFDAEALELMQELASDLASASVPYVPGTNGTTICRSTSRATSASSRPWWTPSAPWRSRWKSATPTPPAIRTRWRSSAWP